MSNIQVQLGGQNVQVQVQSSGFARANAAVSEAAASAAAAAASESAAAASAAAAAAEVGLAALKANNLSDLASAPTARTNLGGTATGVAAFTAVDAAALRAAAGLGSIATQAASAVAITGGTVTGITDLAVADGGTGASSASAARDNLGLTIGANVQAYDADLTTWAGITPGTGVGAALAINVGSAGAFTTLDGAGGTPSSITLTNATGLPVAGITSSTTQALGVGSLELGDASDTTLARSSAGDMTIEGNLVYRAGGTDVQIADGGTGASTAENARYALGVQANNIYSLLNVLTSAERVDVLAGTNAIDITAKLAALLSSVGTNYPGGIVDASMVRGTWTWTADPFNGLYVLPVTLRTGRVTIKKNFNPGPVRLPSLFHWSCENTVVQPTVTITSITDGSSPATGLLQTTLLGATCSGTAAGTTATLAFGSDAGRLTAGCRIGFPGFAEYTPIQHVLDGNIDASVTSFSLTSAGSPSTTIGNSTVYLKIDSEIVRGTVSVDGLSVSSVTRGVHGTTAASHTSGATVALMVTRTYEILSVSGTTLTLDAALPYTFSGLVATVGSVNTRISGSLVIDGQYDRVANGAYVWSGLGTTLSNGLWVEGDIDIINCAHGGVFQMGTKNARIRGRRLYKCGRPSVPLGASIWGFGGGLQNHIEFDFADEGYAAIVLDNKSFGVSGLGIVGGEAQSVYKIGNTATHDALCEISGCNNNLLIFDRVSPDLDGPNFDNSLSSGQTATAANATGNTVEMRSYTGTHTATGANALLNTTVINGRPVVSPASITDAAVTITAAYINRPITLNRAGGIAVTLPAASGTGDRYQFIVGTTFTTAGTIKVVGNDIMTGLAILAQDGGDTSVMFETAADSDTVTMDGTTTGGLKGASVELIDIAADTWWVNYRSAATGTEATPFSATV